MRWGNAPRAAIAAALIVTALPAAAQGDPASLFRPKPAPESDAGSVPATAETMGVTPEQFARMNVRKDTMLANRPSRRSDGFVQFEAPLALPGPGRQAVAVAPGAVVASAAVRVDERRWLAKAAIAVGAPFAFTVPAGAVFAGSLDENGEARPCLTRKPYQTFIPPKDEKGEGYPSLCLVGPDAQGRFAAARLYPYYTDRAGPRDIAVAPVQLDSIAPGTSHPWFGAVLAVRRFRVVEVPGDSVTLALEMATGKRTEESGPLDPFAALPDFRTVRTFSLPLGDGSAGSLDGVTLTLHRTATGWTVTSSGRFTEWVTVSPDGTRVTLGDYTIGPRAR
ncbi:MAG: hypothetical protein V4574_12280 [Pseudomonadota bacterium]